MGSSRKVDKCEVVVLLTGVNCFELNKRSNNKGSAGVLLSLMYCLVVINDGKTGLCSTS